MKSLTMPVMKDKITLWKRGGGIERRHMRLKTLNLDEEETARSLTQKN